MQPPVQVFGIEGRYATALYSAATKQKQLDSVEGELKTLKVHVRHKSAFYKYADIIKSNTIGNYFIFFG